MQHVHETGEPVPLMSVDDSTGDLVRAARGGDREAFGLPAERSWHRLMRLARYEPARTASGKPVAVFTTVTISFLLDRSAPEKPKK